MYQILRKPESIAPLIMNPLLAKANSDDISTETACPGEEQIEQEPSEESKKYILIGFGIVSGIIALAGILWILLTVWGVLDIIRQEKLLIFEF